MKKKTMDAESIKAAAEAFAAGNASREKLEKVGVTQRDYPAIKRTAKEQLEAFRDELSGVLEGSITKLATRLEAETDKLSTGQIPVALGILMDKHKALHEADPLKQVSAMQLHLTRMDANEVLRGLLGPEHARIMARAKEASAAVPVATVVEERLQ